MRYSLSIIFVFFFFISPAQVPGYMGKRFTVGYLCSISPNFSGVVYNATFDYSGPVLKNGLKLNYVISSKRELCFGINYMVKRIDNTYYRNNTSGAVVPYFEKFNLLEYNLGFRRFRQAKFAPLGAYHICEIIYCSGWIKYDPYQEVLVYDANKVINYGGGRIDAKGAGFAYSVGKQRIFSDKYVLDVGLSGTMLLFFSENSKSNYENHLVSAGPESMAAVPILNFHIGIGFLAF